MHQLNENLLRAATGQPSLQAVGATIVGASAESDPPLPPGRFSRLVDGCNTFYSDPANARLRVSYPGAWCECLRAEYENVMTLQEKYLYANDYYHRFRGQIESARESSNDPAWPRLHPAFEKCAR